MKIRQSGADKLTIIRGGGFLVLFGLPFLLSGLGIIIAGLTGLFSGEGAEMIFIVVPFGGIFLAVGAGVALGRAGLSIDKATRQVTAWWGLLIPLHRKQQTLDGFSHVMITKEVRKSKNSSRTVFPVRLEGETTLNAGEYGSYLKSRRCAERIARFVQLPLHDGSKNKLIVREPDKLDESVRDRMRRERERVRIPARPQTLRSEIVPRGYELEVAVPASGLQIIHYLQIAAGLVFPLIVLFMFVLPFLKTEMARQERLFALIFIGIFFMLLPFVLISGGAFRSAFRRFYIKVNSDQLTIRQIGIIFGRTQHFKTDEIEEFSIGVPRMTSSKWFSKKGIVILTDEKSVSFGQSLPEDELYYLKALLMQAITA